MLWWKSGKLVLYTYLLHAVWSVFSKFLAIKLRSPDTISTERVSGVSTIAVVQKSLTFQCICDVLIVNRDILCMRTCRYLLIMLTISEGMYRLQSTVQFMLLLCICHRRV